MVNDLVLLIFSSDVESGFGVTVGISDSTKQSLFDYLYIYSAFIQSLE